MVRGSFTILASKATWMARWAKIEHDALRVNRKSSDPLPDAVVAAEAFSGMLAKSGGEVKNVVVHHVDVPLGTSEPTGEIVGIGPVPLSVYEEIKADAIHHVVLSVHDKLTRYYEQVKPAPDRPLPDVVKRAVRAHGYDRCAIEGCGQRAVDVDHIVARTHGGGHHLENLQALCEMHHDAKTKIDAPGPFRSSTGEDENRFSFPKSPLPTFPSMTNCFPTRAR
jgi:hypothetical protein